MVINNATSTISFWSVISYNQDGVTLSILHKGTKTEVLATGLIPTIVGTKVTLSLPSLATINAVAQEKDELNVRVYKDGVLLFEYLAYWVTSTEIYKNWKHWDTTTNNSKKWVTL